MLTVVLALFLNVLSGEDSTEWLLVRGKSELPKPLTYKGIAGSYLKLWEWRIVESAAASENPATSRMVVGTPGDNPLVKSLARDLGIRIHEKALEFRGHHLDPGTGLVLLTEDPDGKGSLALFTGIDSEGVFSGFSVRVNMSRSGFMITRRHQVVFRGTNEQFDTSKPEIVRLDRDFDFLHQSAGDASSANVALRVTRGLAGYKFVYEAAVDPNMDLFSFMQDLLTSSAETIEATRRHFAERDLSAEILKLFARCVDAIGKRPGPQPVYYVLYGHPAGTNAKTSMNADQATGRPQVLLNLCMLADPVSFEVAVLHETIHTLQNPVGKRLVELTVHEGVATHLSQVLRPGTKDNAALMWSNKDLRSAKHHHDKILAEFRKVSDSKDESVHSEFLQAGNKLSKVPGVPSRSGYYLGWLAVRAWSKKHSKKGYAKLLAASPDEIFAALK